MITRFTLLFFPLLAATAAFSQDRPHLPQDVPPVVAMATAKELPDGQAGRYQIESLTNKDSVIILLSRKDGKGDGRLLPNYEESLSATVPAVIELKEVPTTPAVFDVAKRLKPIQVKTKKEAAKYFTPEAMRTLDTLVDFDSQFVLIFAWKGSGQDRLTHNGPFAQTEDVRDVEFRLSLGRTRDLRPHLKVYAVRSNLGWKLF